MGLHGHPCFGTHTRMTDAIETQTTEIPKLRGLTEKQAVEVLDEHGFKAFRGKQVFHWLQAKLAREVSEMKNLPADLKIFIEKHQCLGGITHVKTQKQSDDGSVKFLFELDDGKNVESVLMPGSGQPEKMTLCISSQVGCAVDCKFCVTGKNGFFRHMRADEIVDQVLFARKHLNEENKGRTLRNIVFMGMGEPLLNTDSVIQAMRVLTEEKGAAFHPKRITVSTSGIAPGLEQLIKADLGVGLAISLNAPNDEKRNEIMPINKRYPLAELLEICHRFPLQSNQQITFEYVLIKGFNDNPEDAAQVVKLMHGMKAKVNLIPFNPDPCLPYERPSNDIVTSFHQFLKDRDVIATVRWSKALDVSGACGQLAGQYRQKGADGKYKILPRD